jgi:peptidoglycan/xylan/chitin deacetylase (PgdA/CDA1 family)
MGGRIRLAAAALALAALWGGAPEPALASVFGRIDAVAGVDTSQQVVALTFDDGPSARFTPQILRILEAKGAIVTFFVLGPSVRRHQAIVRREFADGDEVACHGMVHVDMSSFGPSTLLGQYRRCDAAVLAATGTKPADVRPPYGLLMPKQFDELRAAGFTPVLWDVNGLPWGDHAIARRIGVDLVQMHPGAIVLLHDGRQDRSDVVKILPALIDGLVARGYRFVTVSQLLHDGPVITQDPTELRVRFCMQDHGTDCNRSVARQVVGARKRRV